MYHVITYGDVLEQVAALPAEALLSYAEVFGVLELAPHGGRPYNEDKPDGPMREFVFGVTGQGSVIYLILEDQREVHIVLVQWVG